jgi:serine/threonine-protein kinase
LSEADLSEADLSGFVAEETWVRLRKVGIYPGETNLKGANLKGANLRGAKLTQEHLASCASLAGAIMPNGQKREDLPKDKETRGEDG